MNHPVFIFLLCLFTLPLASAHEGHDHAEEPGHDEAHADGPICLNETQRANLGLQTVQAKVMALAPSVNVPAVLVLPPERHARITAPFEGRVEGLLVKLGEPVKKGQPLLKVAPRTVGSPVQDLRAPMDGVVFEQKAVVGTAFTPETTLMQTGDYGKLLAQGIFYQSPELVKIRTGQKASVLLDVFPGERFEGLLQRIDPGHGDASPFFHVYALIPNPDGKLIPNFRARLNIETGESREVVAVPVDAILGTLGKRFLFVEGEDGHFERREVETGIKSGGWMEIRQGVKSGERVVTVGNYQLQYAGPDGAEAAGDADHCQSH